MGLPVVCETNSSVADEPAAFEPGDISIGEPIALPFAGPRGPAAAQTPAVGQGVTPSQALDSSGTSTTAAPSNPPPGLAPIRDRLPSAEGLPEAEKRNLVPNRPQAAVTAAGQGWLGIAVGESSVPGRWVVDTVAAVGPAAAAGILPGDEVRAINGLPLRNADEVSQALTAIAPGQVVGMAVARGEQVRDVQLTAAVRPPVAAMPAPPFAAAPPLAPPAPAAAAPAPFPAPAAPHVPAGPASAPAAFSEAVPPRAAQPAPFDRPRIPAPVAPVAPERPAVATGVPSAEHPSGGRTALGVRTVPIDEGLRSRFQLPDASGAYVIGVVQDLPASKAGVPPGSVIVSLNDRPVRSPAELTQLVTSGPVGRPLTLEYVLPGGTPQRADVVLQTLEKPLEEALVGPAQPLATGVPTLEPGPATTARRPSTVDAAATAALRDEIRWLQSRLSTLERRLDALADEGGMADDGSARPLPASSNGQSTPHSPPGL